MKELNKYPQEMQACLEHVLKAVSKAEEKHNDVYCDADKNYREKQYINLAFKLIGDIFWQGVIEKKEDELNKIIENMLIDFNIISEAQND